MVHSLASASMGNHCDYESQGPGRLGSVGLGAQPPPTLRHLIVFPPAQASRAMGKHLSLYKQTQTDGQWTLFV